MGSTPASIDEASQTAAVPRRRRVVSGVYGSLAVVLLATLIAQCILTASEGRSLANTFSYFTIQSNVLVMVSSALLAILPLSTHATWWRLLRLSALVGITVTGIVYALFLAQSIHLHGVALLYNEVFHRVVPAVTLLAFFVVEPRHRFLWRDFAFLAWPALWLAYTMVRGAWFHPQFTGFSARPSDYPYPFLDVGAVPLSEFVGSVSLVLLMLVGASAVYIAADRRKPFGRRVGQAAGPPNG